MNEAKGEAIQRLGLYFGPLVLGSAASRDLSRNLHQLVWRVVPFFEATRDQYALLITSILFWIFGYWGVAGPLLMTLKVRSVFRTIESVGSRAELEKALQSPDAKDVAIDLIAAENHVPRFLAARVYRLLIERMFQRAQVG